MAMSGMTYHNTTARLLAGAAVLFLASEARADFDAAYALGALNINDGFRINGVAAGDRLGQSVGSAGDINGDGIVICCWRRAGIGQCGECGSGLCRLRPHHGIWHAAVDHDAQWFKRFQTERRRWP